MEQVGQITPDFQIMKSGDPRILMVVDTSSWVYAENKTSYLSIRLPGSSKYITHTFKKYAVNNLNSHNLGLSCLRGDCTEEVYTDVPDGIYSIKLLSGYEGIEKERYYLKTDKLELEIAKRVTLIGFSYSEEVDNKVKEIGYVRWNLYVAESWTKLGDFIKADRYYQEAVKMFNKCK